MMLERVTVRVAVPVPETLTVALAVPVRFNVTLALESVTASAPNWAANHTPFAYGGNSTLQVFAMDMDAPPNMELYVNPAANSLFVDTGIAMTSWFHVAATWDGTVMRAYVNGTRG